MKLNIQQSNPNKKVKEIKIIKRVKRNLPLNNYKRTSRNKLTVNRIAFQRNAKEIWMKYRSVKRRNNVERIVKWNSRMILKN